MPQVTRGVFRSDAGERRSFYKRAGWLAARRAIEGRGHGGPRAQAPLAHAGRVAGGTAPRPRAATHPDVFPARASNDTSTDERGEGAAEPGRLTGSALDASATCTTGPRRGGMGFRGGETAAAPRWPVDPAGDRRVLRLWWGHLALARTHAPCAPRSGGRFGETRRGSARTFPASSGDRRRRQQQQRDALAQLPCNQLLSWTTPGRRGWGTKPRRALRAPDEEQCRPGPSRVVSGPSSAAGALPAAVPAVPQTFHPWASRVLR